MIATELAERIFDVGMILTILLAATYTIIDRRKD